VHGLAATRCTARFVARENRFVVRARLGPLAGGAPDRSKPCDRQGPVAEDEEVRAYLPNTARLTDLLVPDAPLILHHNHDPGRRTRWTVTRVWDGTWVALEATVASRLVADHLDAGGGLPDWPAVRSIRREVGRDGHRLDVEVALEDGRVGVVEVKSLSRSVGGVAPLSSTPSTRGVAHLAALTRLVADGIPAAVVFVVQRQDVEVLDLAADADPSWQRAVQRADEGGVHIVAFRCEVDEHHLRLGPTVPVRRASARLD
jgi:DNA-binding sugar fermentation-stimulating protein